MTINTAGRVKVPAVARALEVSEPTVRRWASQGQIPSARRTLTGWDFDPVMVARWASHRMATLQTTMQEA